MEGGSVTREMIHTRREQVKKQIKQVERLLSREKRATRRAHRKASRLHNKLGSSTARSGMSTLTARTDPRAHTNGANYRRGRKDAVPHSPISGPVAEIKPLSYYSRAARQGKSVAKLLDASNTGAPVDPTATLSLSQSLHVYKPDSVRGELEADWDLRHPRHQTELTRYVDVVLRQNLAPFQSTAMMP